MIIAGRWRWRVIFLENVKANGNILKVSLEGQGVNIAVYRNAKTQEMFKIFHPYKSYDISHIT